MGYFGSLMSAMFFKGNEDGSVDFSFEGKPDERFVDNSVLEIIPGAYGEYINPQVGDPWKDSSTLHSVNEQEKEIFQILEDYLGVGGNNVKGYVTSGGTEGNLASLWWSKRYLNHLNRLKLADVENSDMEYYKKKTTLFEMSNPLVYFTKGHTHYSLYKICNILNLEYIEIEANQSGQMDIIDFQKKINEHVTNYPHRSLVVSANVGNTQFGAIDDIPAINKILKNIPESTDIKYTIHADGAYLGICLPLLKPFGNTKEFKIRQEEFLKVEIIMMKIKIV